jgi:hypothetical protein
MGILETVGYRRWNNENGPERQMSELHVDQSGTKTSSGATFVAVVQPAHLWNIDNLARRGDNPC